jgi:ankyrin repeat protein
LGSLKGLSVAVRKLLEKGADILEAQGGGHGNALIAASLQGHKEVAEMLLEELSRTPLSWAARHGHEAPIMLLLGTGRVDVDASDGDDQTPLWRWATGNGHRVVVDGLDETIPQPSSLPHELQEATYHSLGVSVDRWADAGHLPRR